MNLKVSNSGVGFNRSLGNPLFTKVSNLGVCFNRGLGNPLFTKVSNLGVCFNRSLGNPLFTKVSDLGAGFNRSLGNLLFTKRPSCPVSALSKAEADSQYEEYGKKISFGGIIPIYDVHKEFHTDSTGSPKPEVFIGKIRWYHFENVALYYKGRFWSIVKCCQVDSVLKATTQNYPCTFQLANSDYTEFVNVQFYPDGYFYHCVYRIM